ncbi:GMC family oxidoreductase [Aureliella helgolandensis]|uniref:Alcohol dehydrogenase [acceptor] n=1 Tax=Aureliella helgolandensis TaxID=2527968 RepID=A0A518G854_9BACT|nr:GMC family oxidoreductase [Aureliella helgolandensis]QDV24766.1 Alcohol dehydrogenase [acceptor] [Aureliella helgolandensis]
MPCSADSVSTSERYRFIIVGGGSAGCLLARLLAERGQGPIALLEAGGDGRDVRCVVPNFYPRTFGSCLDWNYRTTPQTGLLNRALPWPRGKVIGGSGAINALIYLQPAQADLQRWGFPTIDRVAEECSVGALSSANATAAPPSLPATDGRQCTFSQLPLEPVRQPHPWTQQFLDASKQLGCTQHNRWTQSTPNTSGIFTLTQAHGRRVHTGLQLLESAQETFAPEPQLYRSTQVQVERILLEAGRARGVEFVDRDARVHRIFAEQEVILCGGAIGSPMLLMQSGVGPEEQLREAGILCQQALPGVGKNLQDHLVYPIIFRTRESQGLPRRFSLAQRDAYRQRGDGPLASNIAEAGALLNVPEVAATQFQIHFTPSHYLKYPATPTENHFCSLAITDLHPASRGTIRPYRTANGAWLPRVDPNYLSSPQDVSHYMAILPWLTAAIASGPLNKVVQVEVLPGPRCTTARKLEKSLRMFAQTIFHPVGTCRFGNSDVDGVVDGEFRVHGISGLRIADASVLPDLPAANTNASALWVAWQCAERLRDR